MKKTIITILVTAIFTAALTTSIMYPNYLDMASVTDYETTDTGLMLYTSSGSGWYIEK